MEDQDELDIGLRAVIKDEISRMWKTRVGKFIGYAQDDTTFRKINLQINDIEPSEVPQVQEIDDVPLAYFGNKNGVDDFKLVEGDELLVFFCDRSTDNWRSPNGSEPSVIDRDDEHSIDYAIAFPITTIHNSLFTPIDGIKQFKVKDGQKVQIGTDNSELLKLFHLTLTTFDSLLKKLQGQVDIGGTGSTGTLKFILPDLAGFESDNLEVQATLEKIAEV